MNKLLERKPDLCVSGLIMGLIHLLMLYILNYVRKR